jgi:hypothetical protein
MLGIPFVNFTLATRSPSHSDGCDPLKKKVWTLLFQNEITNDKHFEIVSLGLV